MAKNYYSILDLSRNCTELEIVLAYRKLALRYHPNKTKEDKISAFYTFNQISEAYEVLSDYKKRSCYDQLGEFGLKQGGPDGKGGYRYLNNAEEIFSNFFKSEQTLKKLFDVEEIDGSLFGSALRGMTHPAEEKPKDLIVLFPSTLEDLYNGCLKTVYYERIALSKDLITTFTESLSKNLEIHKGFKSGHEILFKGQGNMSAKYPSSDLIFRIDETPHRRFKRKDNDLHYTHKIKLLDSLISLPIEIKTLDLRILTVSFEEIINPETLKILSNEGMPIHKENTSEKTEDSADKGNLIIRVDIIFPKHIPDDKKTKVIELLS